MTLPYPEPDVLLDLSGVLPHFEDQRSGSITVTGIPVPGLGMSLGSSPMYHGSGALTHFHGGGSGGGGGGGSNPTRNLTFEEQAARLTEGVKQGIDALMTMAEENYKNIAENSNLPAAVRNKAMEAAFEVGRLNAALKAGEVGYNVFAGNYEGAYSAGVSLVIETALGFALGTAVFKHPAAGLAAAGLFSVSADLMAGELVNLAAGQLPSLQEQSRVAASTLLDDVGPTIDSLADALDMIISPDWNQLQLLNEYLGGAPADPFPGSGDPPNPEREPPPGGHPYDPYTSSNIFVATDSNYDGTFEWANLTESEATNISGGGGAQTFTATGRNDGPPPNVHGEFSDLFEPAPVDLTALDRSDGYSSNVTRKLSELFEPGDFEAMAMATAALPIAPTLRGEIVDVWIP